MPSYKVCLFHDVYIVCALSFLSPSVLFVCVCAMPLLHVKDFTALCARSDLDQRTKEQLQSTIPWSKRKDKDEQPPINTFKDA